MKRQNGLDIESKQYTKQLAFHNKYWSHIQTISAFYLILIYLGQLVTWKNLFHFI